MKNLKYISVILIFGLFTANLFTQERPLEITNLPLSVQEKLEEVYQGWEPTEAAIVKNVQLYEKGSFYRVMLNNIKEQGTKTVMITYYGDIINEQE